jgi:VWFA-related protein
MVGSRFVTTLACFLALYGSTALAQQESIPDAPQPKATPSPAQFPDDAPPAPKNPRPQSEEAVPTATPTPPPPQGEGADVLATDLSQLPRFTVSVNFVQLPVTVKDRSGRLVPSLTSRDFTVLEDGKPQRLNFFYSGSFPLSAAVVVATELPAGTMKKVNETLPALLGAFSQYDEVALYRYGHTVSQASGFTGASNVTPAILTRVKRPGREGGPPAIYGPIAAGPTINGHEADPGVRSSAAAGSPNVPPPVQESYVLNDAILRAAQDLSRRPRERRKIIFVISDGHEYRSSASYDEVRKVLLSHGITVYAVGVDTAAMPIYDKLNRIRLIGFGYGNILGKYASDTGGDTFASIDRQSIEEAYSRITEVARNQYTLGYNAKATASSAFRSIVVNVHRPGLRVQTKDGYYPLPPQSSTSQ